MDTKQLRQKILDLAIRGKLVPQDPNDEPASVLLERVKAEKERLIAEGKIKRSKKSAASSDKPHYPFEIPNTWVWTTLGELFFLQAGKNITADKINYEKNDVYRYPCYGGNGIRGYVVHYNKSGKYPIVGRQGALCGNLNYAEGKFYATEHAVPVKTFAETIPYLAFLFLKQINLNQYATATAQPGLSVNKILDVPIPLPPKEEQVRIVQEVLKLEAIVESIETNKEELFESLSKVKSTILEYAISGKLVPQNPADEPAVDLLKRISPNAVVSTDTSHYGQLPNGWCYTTMNYICQLYDGEKIEDMELINLDAKYLRGKSEGNTLNKGRFVPEKMTMILVDGENSGEIFTAPIDGYQGSTFKLLEISEEMNAEYVKMIIRIYQKRLRDNKVGSAIPHLNKKLFREILVPVPPIAEQTRIVGRTNQLMSKITELTEAL